MVLVKLFANLRPPGSDGRFQLKVEPGATVLDVLEALFAHSPALRQEILDPATGGTRPFVNLMIDGRLIRDLQGLRTPVRSGETLAIFPPAAGG